MRAILQQITTKFSSTLAEQWTVELGGTNGFLVDRRSMVISPDGTKLYWIYFANNSGDQSWFGTLDTSDGSYIRGGNLYLRGDGAIVLGGCQIACNSTHVFIAGLRKNGTYYDGIGLLCLEQAYWDAADDGDTFGEFNITTNLSTYHNSSSDFTLASDVAGSTTLTTESLTQSAVTNTESAALDVATTVTTQEL